ncbi:MAG: hypothetical protein M3126_08915 [Candidatus Eremiobacteraeota bacterium]|nr:hypothetical protein [Candidatus Eremiobacteraeota bacterium]
MIIGINILRVNGFLFILLAFSGQLSGPFPFSAGIGDIIVGLLALPLVFAEPRLGRSDARLVPWNVFGLFDLVTAVALGLTSGNGSPLQLIHAGVGSAAITEFPWSFIPLFLVPCYLVGHVIVFVHMRATVRQMERAVAA